MKPTVIFITGTLFQGGAERVISIISEKLLKNYDVNIVCFYSRPVFYKIASGVKLFDLEKDFGCKNIFSKALCLRKFLLSQKKCIVVAFMLPFYVFTVASLWGTNLK